MKTYFGHEYEYRRMRKQGIASWELREKEEAIDPNDRRFINDVLAQKWAPKKGKVLEIGCGTGPCLRWLAEKGFEGVGLDISPTAIEMAKEQSSGLGLDFQVRDLCRDAWPGAVDINLCLDGHLMHCICNPEDRNRVLSMAANSLSTDGIFIMMSMCAPIDESAFKQLFKGQLIKDDIIYGPTDSPQSFEDVVSVDGIHYLPTRRVPHWHSLITEIEEAHLQPLLIRFSLATPKDPVSTLNVAARRLP